MDDVIVVLLAAWFGCSAGSPLPPGEELRHVRIPPAPERAA